MKLKLCAATIAVTLIFPQESHSGILEGALIGAGIGAAVGLLVGQITPKVPDTTDFIDKMKIDTSFKFGSKFKYQIISDDSSTKRIKYDYPKLFLGYEKYTSNKESVIDTETNGSIEKSISKIGGERVCVADSNTIKIYYQQIFGNDLGEIVKSMTICAESNYLGKFTCASFKEETFFNTHPTRNITATRLIKILFESGIDKKFNATKYSKYSLQASEQKNDK